MGGARLGDRGNARLRLGANDVEIDARVRGVTTDHERCASASRICSSGAERPNLRPVSALREAGMVAWPKAIVEAGASLAGNGNCASETLTRSTPYSQPAASAGQSNQRKLPSYHSGGMH